ncbi:MAG: phospholipid carrier-dependent glycosyltransferase [Thermodesulfobacteriota bacterium]|jgi:4-amino-4-deoxy-L-arabinose transferase|nr:MAG: phospholipid carrier-dependent glycosyltransferase [Thermodesulfobacteriota bacterium]
MKKSALAVIGFFVLVYIVPLGMRPLTLPDETRYAEIPREMLVSGDWVVPYLDGLRYFEKPVMGYWFNAAAMFLFGQNSFAVRLPSALATGGSALLLFLFVRKFGGGFSAGISTAAVFLTTMEVFGVGCFNVLDGLFSMFLTGAMVFFFFAHKEKQPGKKIGFLSVFGVFCGLAFLTKGFLAFAIPVITIVPFMIWERRWQELFRICWVPLLAAFLIALPWSVIIHQREPNFWHYFFWVQHIKRFMSDHAQHSQPFYYFIPLLFLGGLPWTVFVPAAFSGLRETALKDSFLRFAFCWLLFPFLFLSASRGKLGTYILPCFQPLVILITAGLLLYLKKETKWVTIGAYFLAGVTGSCAVGLILNQVLPVPLGWKLFEPGEIWKLVFVFLGAVTWTVFLVSAAETSGVKQKLIWFCFGPLLLMLSSEAAMPERFKYGLVPGEFLLRHANRISPDTTLVSDNYLVSQVCWFYKRSDVCLLDTPGELEYGISRAPEKNRLFTLDQFRELVAKPSRRITLIILEKRFRHMDQLPQPAFMDRDRGFVFAQFYEDP